MQNRSGRVITTQAVAYTGTSAASANAFGDQTRRVVVVANSACHVTVDASPTATTNHGFLPANWEEPLTVTPGQKIAAVRAATGGLVTATDGTLWVAEIG